LKRQAQKPLTRRVPVVGQALSFGDALGATAAVVKFLYEQECREDDDYCYTRWNREYSNCSKWNYLGGRAIAACRTRAADRRNMCIANKGKPSPHEPPEWDPWKDWYGEQDPIE
jgi:hypothetical protein